jgi:nitrous oxidase accessory protein
LGGRVTRAVLALAMLAAGIGPAAGRTWTVGGAAADFPFIAPAVAAAAAGDTIVVSRGVYREDLELARPVRLIGRDSPMLIGTGLGSVIEVSVPGCEVTGFDIEGSGTGESNRMDAAVHLAAGSGRVAHNRMSRVFYGVVAEGEGSEISDNSIRGLADLPFGRRGDGVYLYRAPRCRILRNRISGMRDAIYLQYAPGTRVEGNAVADSRYGLHDMFTDGVVVAGNAFTSCLVGMNMMNCRRARIFGNLLGNNRGVASAGLAFKDCDDSAVEENRFLDNARGLQIEGSSHSRFAGNLFAFNDVAVQIFPSAEENVFTRNEFRENLSPVLLAGMHSSTRWSEDGRGNFWSDYRGFDFAGRGVGAEPHPLLGAFEKIEGNNPAVRLFLRSPAAAALEIAAVGVDDFMSDPAPLVRPRGALPRPEGAKWLFGAAAAVALAGTVARSRRSHA